MLNDPSKVDIAKVGFIGNVIKSITYGTIFFCSGGFLISSRLALDAQGNKKRYI